MSPREASIGSAIFFLAAPGIVAGLIPALITGWRQGDGASIAFTIVGGVLILLSLALLIDCFIRFAKNRGTPAPIAETETLVVSGPYLRVRNPMYLAVLGLIFGQMFAFASGALLAYGVTIWLAFILFVLGYEEPRLKRRFGDAYQTYIDNVPRWRPRFKAWTPPPVDD